MSLSFERHICQFVELDELVLVVYFVFLNGAFFARNLAHFLIVSSGLHTLLAESYTFTTSKALVIGVQLLN